MAANNVYDFFKKEFHLRFNRDPRPDEYWNAAWNAAEEKFNGASQSGPTNKTIPAGALREIAAGMETVDRNSDDYSKQELITCIRNWSQQLRVL